jgi:hypothetical protein
MALSAVRDSGKGGTVMRRHSRWQAVVALVLCAMVVGGCSHKMASYDYSGAYRGGIAASTAMGAGYDESLFPSDQAVIGNDEIDLILRSEVAIPDKGRLAILRMSQPRYWGDDGPMAGADASAVERLQACSRLSSVSRLPSLLIPGKMSVPLLREAAARYQADLLLVYLPLTSEYTRYKSFHRDETKAMCVVEALLLDVRTGIVPFSTTAVEEYAAAESPDDFSFDETRHKAEEEAVGRALLKVAGELAAFLDAAP